MFQVNINDKTMGKQAQLYIAPSIANRFHLSRRNLLLCNKTFKIVHSFDPEIRLLCLYPKEIPLDSINKNLGTHRNTTENRRKKKTGK